MSVKEEGWVKIARFENMGPEVDKEKGRIEDIALDLGLMPEKVIAVEDGADKVEIYIHPEFYSYYQG